MFVTNYFTLFWGFCVVTNTFRESFRVLCRYDNVCFSNQIISKCVDIEMFITEIRTWPGKRILDLKE